MIELWDEPVFRAAVEAFAECVVALDHRGHVLGVHCITGNAVLGADSLAAVGRPFVSLFPEPVGQSFQSTLDLAARFEQPQSLAFVLELHGQRRFLKAKLTRVSDSSSDIHTLVAIVDVTSQALAREATAEQRLVYGLLEAHSSDVITVESSGGRYLYVSPSVERLSGYTADEVLGHLRSEFIHPDDHARLVKNAESQAVFSDGELPTVRFRVLHRDGHIVWVEAVTRRVDWKGKPALLITSRDISQDETAKQHAQSMLAELEEARCRAEAANRAKTEFLAGISHDLRTPLHGLLGMAELMEQTHLTAEQQDYLAAIQQSGNALLARLNDLLDLSKIETGQLDLEVVDFDLIEAVEGLSDLLGRQAMAKGIQLFCHVAADVPHVVQGDSSRVRQILINLISNAIKFTSEGEIAVTVTAADHDRLRFVVRDTGAGMSPHLVAKLLGRQPETTVAPSMTRSRMGSGIGLTIVRQLIGLMGGTLTVKTSPGAGTVVTFELDLPPSKRHSSESPACSLVGRRILATDENVTNRQLIRELLEQAGATVELTSGGVETIRNLLDNPNFDCVILNAHLPDLDGLSTAAMIRSNRTVERMPIILMVSGSEPQEIKRARELGVNATLNKPIRRDILVRAVHQVIVDGSVPDLPEQTRASTGTVLVVEDNELNLRLARGILRRAGYGVVSARDGHEALGQLAQHSVDAVLMDIQLPDMDGLEATQKIREVEAWRGIPIIAMTAHAMKGDAERFLAAGVDACLVKPVNQQELIGMLSGEIARRRSA